VILPKGRLRRVVEINVNGVLANPGTADGWCDRAVTLAHTKFGIHGEKWEHWSGLLTRHIWQEKRAIGVAALADKYLASGWQVFLRGHSNGCDVICRALPYLRHGAIAGAQLVAAACEADFSKNGLNDALVSGRLSRVVLCCSADDRALWAARITHPLLNLAANGYGSLGFTGPLAVADAIEHRVRTHWRPGFDHGTWLNPENLFGTMTLLHAA
jgi:hypothetical protein